MAVTRWCIRVTYPDGRDAFLRHGSRPGYGPIVQFPSRKTADVNLDLITNGLDEGTTATVVSYAPRLEKR
jgi:hypothetical protein